MKRVIALFLSAILLVSLSVPAFAAEPQQSNRIHAALDTPEFKSAYKDLQVVNEIIEEVPNSNICYIYHDLSDGNSISYMLKNNKVVYKAYVVTKEHKVTEYNYSEDALPQRMFTVLLKHNITLHLTLHLHTLVK